MLTKSKIRKKKAQTVTNPQKERTKRPIENSSGIVVHNWPQLPNPPAHNKLTNVDVACSVSCLKCGHKSKFYVH